MDFQHQINQIFKATVKVSERKRRGHIYGLTSDDLTTRNKNVSDVGHKIPYRLYSPLPRNADQVAASYYLKKFSHFPCKSIRWSRLSALWVQGTAQRQCLYGTKHTFCCRLKAITSCFLSSMRWGASDTDRAGNVQQCGFCQLRCLFLRS